MKTIALLLLLSIATPARAADTPFRLSMVAAVAAHGADLATTEYCLGTGTCREGNPLLLRLDQPLAFGALKMGVAGAQLWLIAKLHETHPRMALVANLITTGVFFGLAVANARR